MGSRSYICAYRHPRSLPVCDTLGLLLHAWIGEGPFAMGRMERGCVMSRQCALVFSRLETSFD